MLRPSVYGLFLLLLLGDRTAVAAPYPLGFGLDFARQLNGPNFVEGFGRAGWSIDDDRKIPFTTAARLGVTERALHTAEWAAEIGYRLLPFLTPTVRLHNSAHVVNDTHHTGLFPHLALDGAPFDGLNLRFSFGWFLRWVSLRSAFPFPFWGGTSYYEHDLAVALGLDITLIEPWRFSATAGTIDEWNVQNFNHPLLLVELARKFGDHEWGIFFRHDFLLGFGRSQAWRAGVTLQLLQVVAD